MQPIIYIRAYEFLLAPVYIFILFWLLRNIGKKHYAGTIQHTYLYLGFGAKMFGSIAFALMAQYFFKEGDTFMYFSGGLDFKEAFFRNFPDNTHLLVMPAEDFGKFYEQNFDNTYNFGYIGSESNLFLAKISGFVSIISLNGYLLTSILFGAIAFSGMWRLFILFSRTYPQLTRQCGWCFLFLPSILYWGGGIMRDTICIGAIGWIFSCFYYFFVKGERKWSDLLIMLVSLYVLFHVKAYIAVVLSAVLITWLIILSFARIKSSFNRKLIIASIAGILLLGTVIFFQEVSNFFNDQVFAGISSIILEAQKNYNFVSTDTDASLANFEDIRPTFGSIMSKLPIALNNALFRPYLWESNKLNVLLSAVENTAILLLTAFTFLFKGPVVIFRKLFSNQLLAICFIFSILFAVMIGLTCFNSGSMVRYKIPCLPFFCFSIVLMYYDTGTKKAA